MAHPESPLKHPDNDEHSFNSGIPIAVKASLAGLALIVTTAWTAHEVRDYLADQDDYSDIGINLDQPGQ